MLQANHLQLAGHTLEAPTFLAARQNGILMGGEDSIHRNIGLFLAYFI
jgi:hypothetical protein